MTARAAPPGVRRVAGESWRFRFAVEREAEARFARLAPRLAQIGAAPPLVDLALRASRDERHHAALCAGIAEECGETLAGAPPPALREIGPRHLGPRERLLCEVVAACCITETGSMGVLATLLGCTRGVRLRRVLRRLAADEVGHSRLGWAHLAAEHARGATSFLGPLVPAMLAGSAGADLFLPAAADREEEALLEHGVLPHALKREVFTRTLEEVVLPGLAAFGIDLAPARRWLAERRAALAAVGARHWTTERHS